MEKLREYANSPGCIGMSTCACLHFSGMRAYSSHLILKKLIPGIFSSMIKKMFNEKNHLITLLVFFFVCLFHIS